MDDDGNAYILLTVNNSQAGADLLKFNYETKTLEYLSTLRTRCYYQTSDITYCNGKLYMATFYGAYPIPLIWYDLASGTWGRATPLTTTAAAENNYTIVKAIGTTVYLFNGASNYAYKYDTLTDTWTSIAWISTDLRYSTAVVYQNNIFVFGANNGLYTAVYSTSNNTWTVLPNSPATLQYGCGAVYGSKLYCIGGSNTAVYVLDLVARTWSTLTITGGNRGNYAIMIPVDDGVAMLGADATPNNLLYHYTVATNTMDVSQLGFNNSEQIYPAIDKEQGKIYFLGGNATRDAKYTRQIVYDIERDEWTEPALPAIQTNNYPINVMGADGMVYVIATANRSAQQFLQRYNPVTDTWENLKGTNDASSSQELNRRPFLVDGDSVYIAQNTGGTQALVRIDLLTGSRLNIGNLSNGITKIVTALIPIAKGGAKTVGSALSSDGSKIGSYKIDLASGNIIEMIESLYTPDTQTKQTDISNNNSFLCVDDLNGNSLARYNDNGDLDTIFNLPLTSTNNGAESIVAYKGKLYMFCNNEYSLVYEVFPELQVVECSQGDTLYINADCETSTGQQIKANTVTTITDDCTVLYYGDYPVHELVGWKRAKQGA